MESGVFLLQSDNTLVRMDEKAYEAESLLQLLLVDHPDLLAGDQINPSAPRRWLLIQREAGIPASADEGDRWSVDHLFIDQDAIPTFVEVKRATDTRIRREVVAQMLDYAANATEYWPVDRMRERFAGRCALMGIDPTEELTGFLDEGTDAATFWDLARKNLAEGRVRLLFVADQIPLSLRRIVEFLNRQMSPAEVLAIEIRQFASSGDEIMRTLVPRVIGQMEELRQTKSAPRSPSAHSSIPEDEFLERFSTESRPTARAILEAARDSGFTSLDFQASSSGNIWVRISLASGQRAALSLDPDYLWVSLGRHHPELRDPGINHELRNAILRVAPACKQASNPAKSEIGVSLANISSERVSQLPGLFETMKRSLSLHK